MTLDDAQSAILLAAAKTYSALSAANPTGRYGTDNTVLLNIDDVEYRCRCDSVGIIEVIIRLLGYVPNWGQSTVPGHIGDGWYLSDAVSSFILDKQGNISEDWEVSNFDANDVRPGDIRASASHSHCDIFIGYLANVSYGLSSASSESMQQSENAGVDYLENTNSEDLMAVRTTADSDTAKVLRYVKGAGVSISTAVVEKNRLQSLHTLEVELAFNSRINFLYRLQGQDSDFHQVSPGYFPRVQLYPSSQSATDSYGDSWLTFVPTYRVSWTDNPQDAEWRSIVQEGLVMMYTLDNSNPLLYGKTVFLNEDGTNDYERSKGWVPSIRTQFPIHFRCVLTDAETHSQDYGRSSAYFTNESATDYDYSINQIIKAAEKSTFLLDGSGQSPECDDAHGYLFSHDLEYETGIYTNWISGVEE